MNKFLSKQDTEIGMAIYELGRTPRGGKGHKPTNKNIHLKICLSNKMFSDKKGTETEVKPKQ